MYTVFSSGLIIFYLVILPFLFTRWLAFLKLEEDFITVGGSQFYSLIFLGIDAIFWTLVVPISYLELLERKILE